MYRLCYFVLALTFVTEANAQRFRPVPTSDGPAVRPVLQPTVFAITDADIVVEAGSRIEKATVVIRDGVIESVGSNLKPPADALIISGKGLTVYPGLIDALSHSGFDAAARKSAVGPAVVEDYASEALAVTKADNRKGLTPEFQVRPFLTEDPSAESWRKLGFTARLIAPEGGFLTGQSVLVSLSGHPPRESVLRPVVALHGSLRVVFEGGYPRALMGTVAHCRQAMLDAGHYQRQWAAYERRGQTGKRPPEDPCLAALGLALSGKLPVVFEADGFDAIHRSLDFAEEFQLKPIIYGGQSAWRVADRLAKRQIPVIMRLNFTEPGERESELPQRVRDDRKRERDEEIAGPAVLHKAGVKFVISTHGVNSDKFRDQLQKVVKAGLPADALLRAMTVEPAKLWGVESQLGRVKAGLAAHLFVTDGPWDAAETQTRYVFADGVRFEYTGRPKSGKPKKSEDTPKAAEPIKVLPRIVDEKRPKSSEDYATEILADRKPKTRTNGNAVIRNATVLTGTGAILANTDIGIENGKIVAIGRGVNPTGKTVIDAAGCFVMPGIIDTHSHFAVEGGVNEFSLSMVPEVRVLDVIASEDVQIYRSLAGGVTTARILHGSANCIGGQDAVLKLKYGRPAREMVVLDRPRGVKFALGENVKRTDGRFPNTRLGVEAVYIRAFNEALAYRQTWQDYLASCPRARPLPEPRRDLRLEALADVLSGDLKVHCHCYRSDEILMLLRVANQFKFRLQSLQHVLEGYKIAPEIADHGCSSSLFADWWAYKLEAFDAIPYAGALMHEAGALVCLKSDDNELVRHMYQEAAKLVKYGGMSETEALKTITLNGAIQLGIEKRTGTIEIGKDADLAIFNGHPLNGYARCEMTLIEGEVYFQRSDKLAVFEPARAAAAPPTTVKALPNHPEHKYLIKGVTVHVGDGKVLPNSSVLVSGGRIVSVGATEAPGAAILDAPGMHLFPGMIDAGSVVGLTEVDSARETQDYREGGEFQPDLRAAVGVNPDSEIIPVTRANGVLSVVTRPTGGIIAGQSALLNLAGWTPREMTVVDPLALQVEFPAGISYFLSAPGSPGFGRAYAKKQRDERIRRLKELFEQARVYEQARKNNPKLPVNPRLEALLPYTSGSKPVIVSAVRKSDIEEAIKLADSLKIKMILSGALDAWKLTADLKKRDIPVLYGPVMSLPPENFDPYDATMSGPAKLHAAGVRFCIRSIGGSNTRNLPYEAAMAVSYGLSPEAGLKSVTLWPAQILGVADQLGSIEPGKQANLVLTNGDLLQPTTQVLGLFIQGKPIEPTSKQTRLYERYRERLKEVRDNRAPLGTK